MQEAADVRDSDLPARRGQGRPIGLLMSWLMCAAEVETAAEHVSMRPSSLQQRTDGRVRLYRMTHGRAWADSYERTRRVEEPEEPASIP